MSETGTTLENGFEGLLRRIVKEEIQAAMGQNGHIPPTPQSPTLLTVDELAASLKVKNSHIYDLTRNKKDPIPHVRVGRYPRFELSKVLTWLEEKKKY